MTKELLTDDKIFDCIRAVHIPRDELVVVGGAALQLFGIKKTSDIDVVVPVPTLARSIRHREHDAHFGRRPMHSPIDSESVNDDGLITFAILNWKDFYEAQSVGTLTVLPPPNDRLYSVPFDVLHDEAVDIHGVLVSPPERILDWKQAVNRPKDQEDITLIQTHLARPTRA